MRVVGLNMVECGLSGWWEIRCAIEGAGRRSGLGQGGGTTPKLERQELERAVKTRADPTTAVNLDWVRWG